MSDQTEVLTISKAAEHLGISSRRVQRRLDSGMLEAVTVAGKRCVRLPIVRSCDSTPDTSDDIKNDALQVITAESLTPDQATDPIGRHMIDASHDARLNRMSCKLDATHATFNTERDKAPDTVLTTPTGNLLSVLARLTAHELRTQEKLEKQQPVVPIVDKLLLTLAEAQAMTGLSRAVLRAAIDNGALKAKQIGGSWRVKRNDLEEWITKL